jgi:hypothetical protein
VTPRTCTARRARKGMNTGIQDAYNLAWKLAHVERGLADESLWTAMRQSGTQSESSSSTTTDRLFSVFGGRTRLARLARGRVAPVLASQSADSVMVAQAVCRPVGAAAPAPIRTARCPPRTVRAGGTRRHPVTGRGRPTWVIDGTAGPAARRVPRHPLHRAAVHRTRRRRPARRGAVPESPNSSSGRIRGW